MAGAMTGAPHEPVPLPMEGGALEPALLILSIGGGPDGAGACGLTVGNGGAAGWVGGT